MCECMRCGFRVESSVIETRGLQSCPMCQSVWSENLNVEPPDISGFVEDFIHDLLVFKAYWKDIAKNGGHVQPRLLKRGVAAEDRLNESDTRMMLRTLLAKGQQCPSCKSHTCEHIREVQRG